MPTLCLQNRNKNMVVLQTPKSIFHLAFRIALATYFICHGVHLSTHIDPAIPLASNNISNMIGSAYIPTPKMLQFYSNLQIVMGICYFFGWRIARAGFLLYLLNCVVLVEENSRTLLGMQIVLGTLMAAIPMREDLSEKTSPNQPKNKSN